MEKPPQTLWKMTVNGLKSSQLRWTVYSVIANIFLTLAIWVGVYRTEYNEHLAGLYFLDSNSEFSTGNVMLDGLINGLGTLSVLVTVSFIMLAFVLYDFKNVVKVWLTFSCMLILFGVSGQTFYDLNVQLFDQTTSNGQFWSLVMTLTLTMIYGVVGGVAFLTNSVSIGVHQCFVISNCSLISVFYLRAFPQQTTWFVLISVLFWDIFAVLAPMGPLRRVQEKASDYSHNVLKFIMFAADEDRHSAGADIPIDENSEDVENEERKIRKDVRQLIQMYSEREAQDEQILQKIRQRRAAVNPDSSGISAESPMVETQPLTSPLKRSDKAKDSDRENTDDEEEEVTTSSENSDESRWSRDSDDVAEEEVEEDVNSEISTASAGDDEMWERMAKEAEVADVIRSEHQKTLTAAEALNSGDIRLGFGDFVFYSMLVGQAATSGCVVAVVAAMIGVILGLLITLIFLSDDDTTTPALPVPVFIGTFFYFSSKYFHDLYFLSI